MPEHRIVLEVDEARHLLAAITSGGPRNATQFAAVAGLAALIAEATPTTQENPAP